MEFCALRYERQHIMNHKEFAILAVILFLSVFAWIFFGIYHARTTSTVSQKEVKQVIPLTPKFDNDIINQLRSMEE